MRAHAHFRRTASATAHASGQGSQMLPRATWRARPPPRPRSRLRVTDRATASRRRAQLARPLLRRGRGRRTTAAGRRSRRPSSASFSCWSQRARRGAGRVDTCEAVEIRKALRALRGARPLSLLGVRLSLLFRSTKAVACPMSAARRSGSRTKLLANARILMRNRIPGSRSWRHAVVLLRS